MTEAIHKDAGRYMDCFTRLRGFAMTEDMKTYTLKTGSSPLLISIPHAGTEVPEDIRKRFTDTARTLPDTDWHIPRLYDFFDDSSATIIAAHYSRYVIDLNRPPDNKPLYPGQVHVPLCPFETFDGRAIYLAGQEPDKAEIAERLDGYWRPYHDELRRQIERIKKEHGYVILYDAHSIKGEISRLFDGALPDLNLGTVNGTSCASGMEKAAFSAAQGGPYTTVLNGRFIGGHIIRCYGDPANHVHALQMELTCRNYMDENSFAYDEEKAAQLRPVLRAVLQAVTDWGKDEYAPARATPAQGL